MILRLLLLANGREVVRDREKDCGGDGGEYRRGGQTSSSVQAVRRDKRHKGIVTCGEIEEAVFGHDRDLGKEDDRDLAPGDHGSSDAKTDRTERDIKNGSKTNRLVLHNDASNAPRISQSDDFQDKSDVELSNSQTLLDSERDDATSISDTEYRDRQHGRDHQPQSQLQPQSQSQLDQQQKQQAGQRKAQQREMVRRAARRAVVFGLPYYSFNSSHRGSKTVPGRRTGTTGDTIESFEDEIWEKTEGSGGSRGRGREEDPTATRRRTRKCEALMDGRVVEPSFAKGDWGIRWRED